MARNTRSKTRRRPRGDGTRGPRTSSAPNWPPSVWRSNDNTFSSIPMGDVPLVLSMQLMAVLWAVLACSVGTLFVVGLGLASCTLRILGALPRFLCRAVFHPRRVFMNVFVIFLLAGFCLEGNVGKRGAIEDNQARTERRIEISKLSNECQAGLLQQRLKELEALPIVKSATTKNPANQRHSALNDWGVRI